MFCSHLPRCSKCRPVIEDRVAVVILPQGDVERDARAHDQERIQAKPPWQCHRTADEGAISHVIGSWTVVLRQVVLVVGKLLAPFVLASTLFSVYQPKSETFDPMRTFAFTMSWFCSNSPSDSYW